MKDELLSHYFFSENNENRAPFANVINEQQLQMFQLTCTFQMKSSIVGFSSASKPTSFCLVSLRNWPIDWINSHLN